METLTFFDLLMESQMEKQELTKMLVEATKRLNFHQNSIKCMVKTDQLYPMHVKYLKQTTMEIGILQAMVDYELFMNEGSTIQELKSSTNSSSTHSNDFSSEGIRQMVESTVPSSRARRQLITYISELQINNTLVHSPRSNSAAATHHPNETLLVRRENEIRREQSEQVEGLFPSLNSSSISHGSQSSSNDPPHRHGSLAKDFDSNVSSHSASSIIHHQAGVIEQPKYFDRKRGSLQQQQLSASEIDSSSIVKKVCLDDIMDSSDDKAQTERDENEEAITNCSMDD